jgi:hypothetical protein
MSKNKNQKKVNQISPMDIHQDATATTPSQQPSEAETIQVGIRIRAIRKQRGPHLIMLAIPVANSSIVSREVLSASLPEQSTSFQLVTACYSMPVSPIAGKTLIPNLQGCWYYSALWMLMISRSNSI